METKIIENIEAESAPLYSIRWGAVFASLVVGIGVQILLMLIGAAAGLAVYGSGAQPEGGPIPIAALAWNGASLFIAALIGGYVAGRASGLRRSIDGVLHGLVSWGAALLFFIVVTGSLTGSAVTSVFGMASGTTGPGQSSASAMAELFAEIERGDREAAVRTLQDGFGLNADQAASAAERALSMGGGEGAPSSSPGATGPSRSDLERAAKVASAASTWLSIIVLLSLLGSAGGGLIGARGARQRALPGRHADHRIFRHRGSLPDAT